MLLLVNRSGARDRLVPHNDRCGDRQFSHSQIPRKFVASIYLVDTGGILPFLDSIVIKSCLKKIILFNFSFLLVVFVLLVGLIGFPLFQPKIAIE